MNERAVFDKGVVGLGVIVLTIMILNMIGMRDSGIMLFVVLTSFFSALVFAACSDPSLRKKMRISPSENPNLYFFRSVMVFAITIVGAFLIDEKYGIAGLIAGAGFYYGIKLTIPALCFLEDCRKEAGEEDNKRDCPK